MNTAHLESGLRSLLLEWNPIGPSDIPEDEYDCMIDPLLSKLQAGAGQSEVDAYLRHELVEHFGMSLTQTNPGDAAERIVSWWETRYSV